MPKILRTRHKGLMMLSAALLVAALAGCQDGSPTGPESRSVTDQPEQALAIAALEDALHRIVPALGPGAAAADVRSALTALLERRDDGSLLKLELALEHLTTQHPNAAADADAIRLATIWR